MSDTVTLKVVKNNITDQFDVTLWEDNTEDTSYIIDPKPFMPRFLQESKWMMSIIDCLAQLLKSGDTVFGEIEQCYEDLIFKTRNYTRISSDAKIKILEELGFGYISDAMELSSSQLSDLLMFLNLIYLMKGKKEGLLLCLQMLGLYDPALTEYKPWDEYEDPENRIPFTATFKITSNYFFSRQSKLSNFVRSYMLPWVYITVETLEQLAEMYAWCRFGVRTDADYSGSYCEVIVNAGKIARYDEATYDNSNYTYGAEIHWERVPYTDTDTPYLLKLRPQVWNSQLLQGLEDPDSDTEGFIGQFYLNQVTGTIFKCVNIVPQSDIADSYVWESQTITTALTKARISNYDPNYARPDSSYVDYRAQIYLNQITKNLYVGGETDTTVWYPLSVEDFITWFPGDSLMVPPGRPVCVIARYDNGVQNIRTDLTSNSLRLMRNSTITYASGLTSYNGVNSYNYTGFRLMSSTERFVGIPDNVYLFYNNSINKIVHGILNYSFFVQNTIPINFVNNTLWYNPFENKLYWYYDGWFDVSGTVSLPFAYYNSTANNPLQILKNVPYDTKITSVETNGNSVGIAGIKILLKQGEPNFEIQ